MLARIVRESLTRGRRRKLLSGVAVALGITVATTLATLALDVGDKVSRELRSFGANISVTPAADSLPIEIDGLDFRPQAAGGAFLAEADLKNLKKIFWRNNIVAFAPFLFAPGRVQDRDAILIGSWFDRELQVDRSEAFRTGLRELHPAWRVRGEWPRDTNSAAGCLVGRRLAAKLGVGPGEAVTVRLASAARSAGVSPREGAAMASLLVRGILETGGPEEDQVIVPLSVLQKMTGLEGKVRSIQVSALTKPEDAFARSDTSKLSPEEFDRWYCSPYVGSIAYQIRQAIPGAVAKPVYQVAETEGKILGQVGMLMAVLAAAALVTAALAAASMMLATVLERRAEIGLLKALGATDAHVAAIFLSEALAIALLGGALGSVAGSVLARRLAVTIFGSPAGLHWVIFPAALTLAVGITLVGCAIPLARGLKISPAVVLRD